MLNFNKDLKPKNSVKTKKSIISLMRCAIAGLTSFLETHILRSWSGTRSLKVDTNKIFTIWLYWAKDLLKKHSQNFRPEQVSALREAE